MDNFIIEEFEFYKVLLFSHHTNDNIEAGIEVPLPDGKAIIRFVKKDLPENSKEVMGSKNIYYVYYHIDMYPHIIDILRYEEPLFFYFNHDNQESYITTGDEPVGEGEVPMSDS